jgi:syntaxin-binding protein 1
MVTPALFIKQISDLGKDRRKLDLPSERPKPKAPAHLFEREELKPQMGLPGGPAMRGPGGAAITQGLGSMTLNSGPAAARRPVNGVSLASTLQPADRPRPPPSDDRTGKLEKKSGEEKEKKKRGFFGSKK